MQINAYDNLISSIAAEMQQAAQVDKNASSKTPEQTVELVKGFGTILEKARVEPDSREAVAQARMAIADGSLYNQQALEAAAENMLNFGI